MNFCTVYIIYIHFVFPHKFERIDYEKTNHYIDYLFIHLMYGQEKTAALDNAKQLYIEKLTEIFKDNNIKSITIVHMEVPCCSGTVALVDQALKNSGKNIITKEYTISLKGQII